MTEETVNVNPDGSTTFEDDGAGAEGTAGEDGFDGAEEMMEEAVQGIDPAIYLLIAIVVGGFLYFLYKRRSRSEDDEYFSNYGKVSVYYLHVYDRIGHKPVHKSTNWVWFGLVL